MTNNKDQQVKQCPPTKPGLYFIKFHLVEASLITLLKLIFNFLQTIYISFINPIFTSL